MNFKDFKNKYQKVEPEHFPNSVSLEPVVSVCIQTYNHEKYIQECLDSVLAQKLNFEYEVLIGEDNSSDKTREICIDYALRYPDKIRLFLHHSENKIKVNNITTGNFNALYNFYQARGKFIAFCEGDDYWTDENKLKYQVRALQSNHSLSCTFHSFTEKFETVQNEAINIEQPNQDITSEKLKNLKYHPHFSTICLKNNFTKLPEEIATIINVDSFFLSFLGQFGSAKFLPEIKPNIYRRHSMGIWTNNLKEKKLLIKLHTFEQIASFYRRSEKRKLARNFKTLRRNAYRSLLLIYLKKFKLIKAINLIVKI